MTTNARQFELQALTDIWTGDVNGNAERLVPTGLLGSIRWWFEVLVRGLGGSPCDPSSKQKTCSAEHHCVVCELFGCTGWARKFRFDVRDQQGAVIATQLKKGEMSMSFHLYFTPLRKVENEEWALLQLTLRLISDLGAIGGKTVLKPSNQNNKKQHADFGVVKLVTTPTIEFTRQQLESYVREAKVKPTVKAAAWASCRHMWFVDGRYLTRTSDSASSFNKMLGRPEAKSKYSLSAGDSWLAGRRGESKKIFSFKSPARSFGFVEDPRHFGNVRDELREIWGMPETNDWFVSGDALIARLFSQEATS